MRDIALMSKAKAPPPEDEISAGIRAVEGAIQERVLRLDPTIDPDDFGYLTSLAGRLTELRGTHIRHLARRRRAA